MVLLSTSPQAYPENQSDVIATYKSSSITADGFRRYLETVYGETFRIKNIDEQSKRKKFTDYAHLHAAAEEARRLGLDEKTEVQNAIEIETLRILKRAYYKSKFETVTQHDVKALAEEYYLANQNNYMTSEARAFSHILIRVADNNDCAAYKKIQEIEHELKSGYNFTAAVEKYSEDKSSKNHIGEAQYYTKDKLFTTFGTALFELSQVGQVSPIIRTKYGYHLIRLDGITAPDLIEYEEVRDDIEKELVNQERERIRKEIIDTIDSFGAFDINDKAVMDVFE
jgi:peptidyl-prolyl cis-trans isomerase C